MFRLLRKLIVYALIIIAISAAFIMWDGGKRLRQVGKRIAEFGNMIERKTESISERSERIKTEIEEKKRGVVKRLDKAIEKAKEYGIIEQDGDRETGDSNRH